MKNICEFCAKKDGSNFKCQRKTNNAMTRCLNVCQTHWFLLLKDNKRRHIKGIPIPQSCELIVTARRRELNYCDKECKEPKAKVVVDETGDYESPGVECSSDEIGEIEIEI